MPGKSKTVAPQDVGTAGYGGFGEPAVTRSRRRRFCVVRALAHAPVALWCLMADWLNMGRLRRVEGRFTAGLVGNPP